MESSGSQKKRQAAWNVGGGKDRDIERSGKSWNDIKKLAQDREEWRVFVCGLYPVTG